eukprot:3234290-Amphidinium_carterae.1
MQSIYPMLRTRAGTRQRPVGSITRVRILGVIPMIDSGETDWKVLRKIELFYCDCQLFLVKLRKVALW